MSAAVPAGTIRDADQAARATAQSEFDRPVLLTAGAGTGKTTALVSRILGWSLDRGWERAARELGAGAPPERIAAQALGGVVAITFTEAAAAEMAARISNALAALAGNAGFDDPALRGFQPELLGAAARSDIAARGGLLLAGLDHLTAETIHAFCRRLLARHPLAAGLHPRIEVDADLAASEEVIAEVVERAARRAYASVGPHPLIELAAFGHGPAQLAAALERLVRTAVPPAALAHDPFDAPGMAALCGRLEVALGRFGTAGGTRLEQVRSGSKARAVLLAWGETTARILSHRPADLGELERWLDELEARWEGSALNALAAWSKGTFSKGEHDALGAAAPAVQEAAGELRRLLEHLAVLAPRRLDLARRALAPLLVETVAVCRSRGLVTFAALLRGARDLLAEHPEVAAGERARIRQLLVDEFQDTDPLQCDLVRSLAFGPGERPGLFLVGDAKQSIFGWRDADLAVFEGFRDEILAAGGIERELAVNFRSQAEVLAEVERVVEPVMIAEPGLQPPYRPLAVGVEATPPPAGTGRARVEYWISWDAAAEASGETRAERAASIEARAIAADLAALHDEEAVPWSRTCLLLRSTTWVDRYLDELRSADVPFVVTRDRLFYRRREVIEAAALVRAVVDPLDALALATWLRSTAAGVPDAALLPLWRRGLPRLAARLRHRESPALEAIHGLVDEVAEELPSGVPGLERVAGWPRAAADAFTALADLRAAFVFLPADRFIETLRQRTLYEASQAACYQGKFRLANLDRLFRRLETALSERGHDMAAIVRSLRRSLKEAPDAPQALPKDAGEDVVQVLTIHKAKGLEFDYVYLAGLHGEGGRDGEVLFDPSRPEEYELLGWPTPGFDAVAGRRRRIEAAERVRTLYVAMTRARQRLVLAGRWPQEPRRGDRTRAKSHLDLLLHRRDLPTPLGELAARCREAGHDALDAGGARWRFLDLVAPAAGERRRERGPFVPRLEDLAASERRLAADRRAAASRQALPTSRPASAEATVKLAALYAARTDEDRWAGGGSRAAALWVGAAIHRLFETWDFGADLERELDRHRAWIGPWLAARATPEAAAATRRAEALLDRLGAGELLRRFAALGPHVVARELPVLLPPDEGCVGFVAGAIDCVVREDDGRLLILDFKTDEVEDEDELATRAAAYAAQEALYVRALGEALPLPAPTRCELWFLWPDRVWPPTRSDGGPALA